MIDFYFKFNYSQRESKTGSSLGHIVTIETKFFSRLLDRPAILVDEALEALFAVAKKTEELIAEGFECKILKITAIRLELLFPSPGHAMQYRLQIGL